MKIIFRWTNSIYDPCPKLERIKDVLCNKFKRTVLISCGVICTNSDHGNVEEVLCTVPHAC